MNLNLKNSIILIIVFIILFSASGYLMINFYFQKSIQLKSFAECLDVVGEDYSNWNTHKETIQYCYIETKDIKGNTF